MEIRSHLSSAALLLWISSKAFLGSPDRLEFGTRRTARKGFEDGGLDRADLIGQA
jgi:hypothetical protein